jgi:hypothetical protein
LQNFCDMRLIMRASSSKPLSRFLSPWAALVLGLVLVLGFAQSGFAQNADFHIFKNYFVTGDYVVGGWKQAAPDFSGYAPGSISIPDTDQSNLSLAQRSVPKGADIVAAYLYWATVEGNQNALVGKQAFFNGYAISGTVLGNPNAPVSWSSGGCSGAANGSKTMRYYRADVRPYLPLDTATSSSTFGALVASGSIPVRLADSGSNGNTAPFALGASLVVVYRVLAPQLPLNGIVLYDGIIAPSNSAQNVTQQITGYYGPTTQLQKLTQIVANGQPNKNETVSLNGIALTSVYGSAPSFPGIYGNWDNPTWVVNGDVTADPSTVAVVPTSSNSGCVSWGAMILSTTVQDTDQDGLLNVWEDNQGYTDAVSGQFVALPGASATAKDIFLELDYLTKLDGTASAHSHLPKRQALDAIGLLYHNHGINLHVDLGNVYQDDSYVIQGGTGGNGVAESSVTCSEATGLCQFPGQPAIGWKGGFEFFQNDPTLGNFQSARNQSYHYILFGHSLGAPRSFWSTIGSPLQDPTIPTLVSIVNNASTGKATVTLKSPAGTVKPGDCPSLLAGCSDANADRIAITGAISQPNLNGVYKFGTVTPIDANTISFPITTTNVATGTYSYKTTCATCFNEPQLGIAYLGPTSNSGHSDFGGGGDSIVTLGLWGADDIPGCQKDPSIPAAAYCDNQVGTTTVQTGTWAHELGHALSLTHGGTYYNDLVNNASSPTYDINCKPNFGSVMNYLFQVRGFADGTIDYSGQLLPNLNEATLSESFGVGPANSLTRWYSNPNAIDQQIQSTTSGGHYAKAHCDGTAKPANEAPAVRVDATPPAGGALDWNNDLVVPNTVGGTIDINNNGILGDPDFLGFNDLAVLNLQQVGARSSAFGFSQSGGLKSGGGGLKSGGGGVDNDGGGLKSGGGGLKSGGGGLKSGGGGVEQDEDTAHSTVGPPAGLVCTNSVTVGSTTYSGCILGTNTPGYVVTKAVPLTWGFPGQVSQSNFGQIRAFNVYKAKNIVGSVLTNAKAFTLLKTITPVAPAVTPVSFYVDTAVKNNDVYTYFVTAVNKQGAQSGPSNYLTVTITTK